MAENPNLNTQEKIVNHMKSLLGEKQLNGKTPEKQNMAVYDVLLLNKAANGVWDRVTDENFPAAGVTVTIPYPEGTNAGDYAFLAMHMLTMSRTGSDGKQYRAGDVEIPSLTLTDDGIEMTLNSLSPIALSWAKIDKSAENPNDQNKDNQNSQITSGDQNKNDQNSQNTTTDQKNTSKKKHKHSGSSSSTSESTVVAVTAASSDAATVTSAQTNDSNAPIFWAMLALISAMAAGAVIYRRRKEKKI